MGLSDMAARDRDIGGVHLFTWEIGPEMALIGRNVSLGVTALLAADFENNARMGAKFRATRPAGPADLDVGIGLLLIAPEPSVDVTNLVAHAGLRFADRVLVSSMVEVIRTTTRETRVAWYIGVAHQRHTERLSRPEVVFSVAAWAAAVTTLPAPISGGLAVGPSLVPQWHGGALLSGGKPGNPGHNQDTVLTAPLAPPEAARVRARWWRRSGVIGGMSMCRYSRTRRSIRQRDERAEELAQILLHTTRDLTCEGRGRNGMVSLRFVIYSSWWRARAGKRFVIQDSAICS